MAEIVQRAIESSIQNLVPLEKRGVFSSDEVKQILEKRQTFEYRLRKVKKSIDDYLLFIAFEIDLLKLVRIRCEKIEIEIEKKDMEHSFVQHIKKLFEAALKKFPSDLSLWLSCLDFYQKVPYIPALRDTFKRMLQIHSQHDWLWIRYAKFEFEENGSSQTAREIFLRALTFHRDSPNIWLEYFKFELLFCSKIRKRFELLTAASEQEELFDGHSKESIWNGKLASIVYENAVEKIDGLEFGGKFLEICRAFNYEIVKEVKEKIFDDLKRKYSEQEALWDLLARDKFYEYRQMLRSDDVAGADEESRLAVKKQAAQNAFSIYQEACVKFENATIWEYYFQFRFQIWTERHHQNMEEELAQLMYLLDCCWSKNRKTIGKEIFMDWIRLYYQNFHENDLAMHRLGKLLMEGSQQWPEDLNVQFFIGGYLTRFESTAVIQKFFDDCLLKKFNRRFEKEFFLDETLMDIWNIYIDWCLLKKISTKKIQKIINDLEGFLIKNGSPEKFSEYFKRKFLSINYHLFGIRKTRKYYEKNKSVFPICRSFFYKMIEIEKNFIATLEVIDDIDKKNSFSNIYEDLIHYFGKNDIQIWLEYIEFVLENFDIEKVNLLYWRALKNLSPDYCQEFIKKYSIFINEKK